VNLKSRKYRLEMAFLLLAVFVSAQVMSMVQTASSLYALQYWTAASEADTTETQVWIRESNQAESVTVYYVEGTAEKKSSSGARENWGMRSLMQLIWMAMATVLLQILTALLLPKRQFIRDLECRASRCRIGPLLVRYQHVHDGEKEEDMTS